MRKQFRILVVLSMWLYAAFWCVPYIDYLWVSPEAYAVLKNAGYGKSVNIPALVEWALFIIWMLVSIGLLLLNSSARKAFVIMYIINLAIVPFSGLLVLTPVETFIFSLIGLLDGAIIAMAYTSVVASEFNKYT